MSLQFRRLLSGCLVVFVIGLVLSCGWTIYVDNNLSASAYLGRLIGRSVSGATLEEMSDTLLTRLPPGTSEQAIYDFLEQHGVEKNRLQGGQFIRYQTKNAQDTILGLFSDPPYKFDPVCSGWGYIIFFQLDAQQRLEGIHIETRGACL